MPPSAGCRRSITRAFWQYLSPVLVERLAAEPSRLRLGGERKTLSILFSDVRGFTTISEALKDEPERLTGLMHRLLNPLSAVVLSAGGTIDKYIGDAIMAFWNAPLDDADHAVHAVEAALGMLKALDGLNAELAAEAAADRREAAAAAHRRRHQHRRLRRRQHGFGLPLRLFGARRRREPGRAAGGRDQDYDVRILLGERPPSWRRRASRSSSSTASR